MKRVVSLLLAAACCAGVPGVSPRQALAQSSPQPAMPPVLLNFPYAKFLIEAPKTSPEEPNFGLNLPNKIYQIPGSGPLSGKWETGGAIDGFAALLDNVTPRSSGAAGRSATLSLQEAVITVSKKDGDLRFTYWGGLWHTPAQGITSDFGTFNSLAPFGSPQNPINLPTFKWWVTWQPNKHFSISGGKMHSLMGTEVGFDYYNPTPLVSELNNMQATPGYGPELHFNAGSLKLSVQYSDAYHTGRINYLSSSLAYNINSDDYLIAFGGENTGHSGLPGSGFARQNSSLIGVGAQFIVGRWLISPEAEVQWLPRDSVAPSSDLSRPKITYGNIALMNDLVYQISERWSLAFQAQWVFQNNDKHDPNAYIFGNWLQSGLPSAPGVFGPGTRFTGIQLVPTWQLRRFFARGDLSYVHLSAFAPGTGYGLHGGAANQLAGLFEIGVLF